MLLGNLYRVRKQILTVLLPVLLIPVMNFPGSGENYNSYRNYGKASIIEPVCSINSSGNFNSGESKPGTQVKTVVVLNLTENNHELASSAAYISSFKNESVYNFRLSTFVTSHFSTST